MSKRSRLSKGSSKPRTKRLSHGLFEKVIVDYWPHAEDNEKWGVELYAKAGDDDATDVAWFRRKEDALAYAKSMKAKVFIF